VKEINAPDRPTSEEYDAYWPSLFVSGGITGAPNWQPEFLSLLKDVDGLIFNPRRLEFDLRDPDNEVEQIKWEAEYLLFSNAIAFWFPKEAACQITLYELGRWTMPTVVATCGSEPVIDNKMLFIGVEPGYRRSVDVKIQTQLARPELEIVDSLKALADQVRTWTDAVAP
jgi:hypothetical protein